LPQLGQPGLFALQMALAELWQSWGVQPEVLLGHGLGQYAAACVAGVFSLEDALRLVARRAALLESLPAGGAMAAVLAPLPRVNTVLVPSEEVALAADHGGQVVLSGPLQALQAVLQRCEAAGLRWQ